jgi:enoyl-[acyl-carrier protein] reductase III
MEKQFTDWWGIILGGSSGFGLAAVEKLARHGMHIAALYRETSAAERALKEKLAGIAASAGVTIEPYNVNALDPDCRETFIRQFAAASGRKHNVRVLLHSIARGNLKPLMAPPDQPAAEPITVEDIRFTAHAMATSLLDWARSLYREGLFHSDARIIGLTSEGAHKYWEGYAAVSIAKASLESLVTYMAVELGRYGLKTNLIQAGVTDTPSLKRIPSSDRLLQVTPGRNPLGRITQVEDIANAIYLLCLDEAAWINGALLHVDGGEHCR